MRHMYAHLQGLVPIKTPLARVRAQRFRIISKEYEVAYENNKSRNRRVVPGGYSSEY